MKVKKEFVPVTITIETPEEFRALCELLTWEITQRRVYCLEKDTVQELSGKFTINKTGYQIGSVLVKENDEATIYKGLITKSDIVEALWTGKLNKENVTAKDLIGSDFSYCKDTGKKITTK